MAAYQRLTKATGVKVCFADTHSPWQCGINENTNGLLRQYLPKGSDLSGFTQKEPDAIAWKLNTRPRKSLGFKCPAELFTSDAFDFRQHHAALFALGHSSGPGFRHVLLRRSPQSLNVLDESLNAQEMMKDV
jgi:transposase, IS30 family